MRDVTTEISKVRGWWIPKKERNDRKRGFHPIESQRPELKQIPFALHWRGPADRDVVVQAGGRLGLWPLYLAEFFDHVHTFEPDPVNFVCMKRNIAEHWTPAHGQIHAYNMALGGQNEHGWLVDSPESDGMHYLRKDAEPGVSGSPCEVTTIDSSLMLPACDALFLDVEGFELAVLRGAIDTIVRFKPLIVVEENALIARYGRDRGDVERWLVSQSLGYKLVGEHTMLPPKIQNDGGFHGSDLVFAVPE